MGVNQNKPTSVVRIGRDSQNYIIPNLKPGERTVYATLLQFSNATQTGITGSLGTIYKELKLANRETEITYHNQRITPEQLKQQEQYQQFVIQGLPQATVHDFVRGGKEVKEAEWHEEWLEMINRRKSGDNSLISSSDSDISRSSTSSEDKNERDEKEYSRKEQKAKLDFLNSISFKDKGVSDPLINISWKGKCPCHEYVIIKEQGFFTVNDNYHIYRDKDGDYYFYSNWGASGDEGPYTLDALKNIIYEKYYKPKKPQK